MRYRPEALAIAAFVALALMAATVLHAARPPDAQERVPQPDMYSLDEVVPLVYRFSAGTTWVRVHLAGESPCDTADVDRSGEAQTTEHVWCFEGDDGDSTWPAVPAGQDEGTAHETFSHWSNFDPPVPRPSRWHITMRHGGDSTDTYNAWAGCDSVNTSGVCIDLGFWVFKEGYGNLWNYPLELEASGQNANEGGLIEFDLRYDTECDYDYLYLEYYDTFEDLWTVVTDSTDRPAVFNSVSGNPDNSHGGTGPECGDDIFHHSDKTDTTEFYHGNSIWLEDVTFPMPEQSGGLRLRWRARSDQFWSDEDGRGDTDGIAAIDNVELTFFGSGSVITDDFETGDFDGISATQGTAHWIRHGQVIDEYFNTYDRWHLEYDPMFYNDDNVCTFSSDWMWAAKPETGPIPPEASGFDFMLVTPVFDISGWTGAVIEYAEYMCMPEVRNDVTARRVRIYDSEVGCWGPWEFPGLQPVTFAGCTFWNMNERENLSPYITETVDSLQFAWEIMDYSERDKPFDWGLHGTVQYLIDNVSFGQIDGTATTFTIRSIELFDDTFSLCDPAHTGNLSNSEMGYWSGISGVNPPRDFVEVESLTVDIADYNGITASNVFICWRHDDGGSESFGPWHSKVMDLSQRDPISASDEGTYRQIIGEDDGGVEDADGVAGNARIWKKGTTVEYYLKVVDDDSNVVTAPNLSDGSDPFEFSVLPFENVTPNGNRILLVDDYLRDNLLDFENSTGFDPTGGAGYGAFSGPVYIEPEEIVLDALDIIYANESGADIVDKYDVQSAGYSGGTASHPFYQAEPNGVSNDSLGLGGYMNDFGTPIYDAIIWMQGTFDAQCYTDTTRLDLMIYIENGGHLISSGDDVSFDLGTGGNNADSSIGFLEAYLGTSFPNENDNMTDDRILSIEGEAECEGYQAALYGECPSLRAFDRLTLAPSNPELQENHVLFRYANGSAEDNGRPAVIYNKRISEGTDLGSAVNFGFGFTAMQSRLMIAAILDQILHSPDLFGLVDPGYAPPVGVPGLADTGLRFALRPALPNPFRTETSIEFSVANRSRVSIAIYNVLGRKVRTLVDEVLEADSYVRTWDGRSDEGLEVSSGVYFTRMAAGDFNSTQKTVFLR